MKRIVRWSVVFVLAASAAACGSKKDDKGGGGGGAAAKPAAGDAANCDKVANTMSSARARHFAVGGKLPQFASAVADACRANAWPEPVRTCLVGAKDDASSKACVDSASDAAAKATIVEDVNKALSAQGSQATW
ncbi:MAG TPA: hypothetical protein VM513_22680 [Kofleriaceae bacterium]|nr:hypothetical protein [Kofleriaceae bacterium]